jgi:ubiquinone/menaquinone biosynthesis C-methylase UbiE
MNTSIAALKAAGDPSRLRILAILDHHELTVGELVQILGQSQPRVSRHLRVLVDAGVLTRKAEGTSAFYRLERSAAVAPLITTLLETVDPADPDIERDAVRLRQLRATRSERAARYFRDVATNWDRMRSTHVPEADIEAALIAGLADRPEGRLLDLGTGTGRILEIAAPHVQSGIGIDTSRDMLSVARDRLETARQHHCQVRHGDVYNLDLPAGTADTAVLHHVLHFLDDPAAAVAEAGRMLAADGCLAVVDFAPHTIEALRHDYQHVRLGFADDEIRRWCTAAGLENFRAQHFTPGDTGADVLTVVLWTATQRSNVPSTYPLEVAS